MTRLTLLEQIADAVAPGDMTDLAAGLTSTALRRPVRDRDQLGARTDREVERPEVELSGVVDDVDLD